MAKPPFLEASLKLVGDGEPCDICARSTTIAVSWPQGDKLWAIVCGDCLLKLKRIVDAALLGFR